MNPLISVIVPVYKVEPYLDRCVRSILNQNYREFELILVDDGSPDRCGEMCDEWAKRDGRIRVFHKKNGGLSSARNHGLDRAKGDYLSFIDSDDWVEEDYLSYLHSLFPEDPLCRLVGCNHRIIRGKHSDAACHLQTDKQTFSRRDAFESALFHGCVDVSAWAKLYRKEVFEALRFPEGRLFEDTWLFGDILNRTDQYVFGGKVCYNYLMRSDSTVNQGFREKNLEYIEAAERLAELAVACDPALKTAGIRRINHARMSVLRYMEHCEEKYKPLRAELRTAVLSEAPLYIPCSRTPKRDRIAVNLLKAGLGGFYTGWRIYGKLR